MCKRNLTGFYPTKGLCFDVTTNLTGFSSIAFNIDSIIYSVYIVYTIYAINTVWLKIYASIYAFEEYLTLYGLGHVNCIYTLSKILESSYGFNGIQIKLKNPINVIHMQHKYALYFMQPPHMHPVNMFLTNLYYEISSSNQYW